MNIKKIVSAVLAAGVFCTTSLAFVEAADVNSEKKEAVKIVQTAGRDNLGEFAPDFARYNDDILFGEVWSKNDVLSLHDRSIVTKAEMAEIITQLGFYAGWPKAWAAFGMAKEVYAED